MRLLKRCRSSTRLQRCISDSMRDEEGAKLANEVSRATFIISIDREIERVGHHGMMDRMHEVELGLQQGINIDEANRGIIRVKHYGRGGIQEK